MLNSVLIVIGYSLFEFDGAPQKKNLVMRKEQVVLNVGAAPTEDLSNGTWTFQISRKKKFFRSGCSSPNDKDEDYFSTSAWTQSKNGG